MGVEWGGGEDRTGLGCFIFLAVVCLCVTVLSITKIVVRDEGHGDKVWCVKQEKVEDGVVRFEEVRCPGRRK